MVVTLKNIKYLLNTSRFWDFLSDFKDHFEFILIYENIKKL